MVRVPDAAGQLKNAPVKAIRGFFSGIGQLLLAADRFRAEDALREGASNVERDDSDSKPTGLDGTSAGQMTTADYVRSAMPDAAAETVPGQAQHGQSEHAGIQAGRHRRTTAAKPRTRKKGQQAPRKFQSLDSTNNVRVLTPDMPAEPSPDDPQPPSADALPVAGYDGLSVATLRSRLRNLDVPQLAILLDYERSAANRADVVTMFERRIAKLEAMRDAP